MLGAIEAVWLFVVNTGGVVGTVDRTCTGVVGNEDVDEDAGGVEAVIKNDTGWASSCTDTELNLGSDK